MVLKEKLDWLKANRKYGDQKAISRQLNINFNTVVAILRGTMYGPNGDAVIREATQLINNRNKQIRKERRAFEKQMQQ